MATQRSQANRAAKDGGFKVPKLPKPKTKAQKGRDTKRKNRQAGVSVICGANKRGGGKCRMAAGHGTTHPGIGKCKFHGGSVPSHVKAAAGAEYRKLLGDPIEINPIDAIIRCIHIRNGEVVWLSDRLAEIEKNEWLEDTLVGKQFHIFARERQAAMNDLVRYSQIAISLGIAERYVRLAETYGEMLANLIRGILDDLQLTPEQQKRAPAIVRSRLIALEGGIPTEGKRPELPQIAGEAA